MLRDSSVVVRTRPQAIPLAMIAIRKLIHGVPLVPYMDIGVHLAAPRAAGAQLIIMCVISCNQDERIKEVSETYFNIYVV